MNLDWKWYNEQCDIMARDNMNRLSLLIREVLSVGTQASVVVYGRSMMGPVITTANQLSELLIDMLEKEMSDEELEYPDTERLSQSVRRSYLYRLAEVKEFLIGREYVRCRYEGKEADPAVWMNMYKKIMDDEEKAWELPGKLLKKTKYFIRQDIPAILSIELEGSYKSV